MQMKYLGRPKGWTTDEVSNFCAMGGNLRSNRRLAEKAGLLAPRPPPDTTREGIERYIAKKYRGAFQPDSHECAEAARGLQAALAAEIEREEAEKRAAAERVQREREQREREQRERERAEEERVVRAEEAQRRAHEAKRAAREQREHRPSTKTLAPGGFKDAAKTVRIREPSIDRTSVQSSRGGVRSSQGNIIVEVLSVELIPERVTDLKTLGALFLNLSVVLSLGKTTAEPTSGKLASAQPRWDPPEQRELPWDGDERWLWCRVNDRMVTGSQLAGVGCIDVRAAQLESVTAGGAAGGGRSHRVRSGADSPVELEVILMAKDPEGRHHGQTLDQSARWDLPVGPYEPPGRPGAHGHYLFQQVEDLENLFQGQCCGTALLRMAVIER